MKRAAVGALLSLCVSTALAQHSRKIGAPGDSIPRPLPAQSGAQRIGTTTLSLVDSSRPPGDTSTVGARRIMLQLWYPAADRRFTTLARYFPDARLLDSIAAGNADSLIIRRWASIATHAYVDARLDGLGHHFPVLLFSHGLGESRSSYTSLLEDLASHGYIVVAMDHPFGGMTIFPDGQVVAAEMDTTLAPDVWAARTATAWAKDASFVLTWLQRLSVRSTDHDAAAGVIRALDFDRVGMLGHSSGGVAALEACRVDPRFKACVDLDGGPLSMLAATGLERPVMLLGSHPISSAADLKARGRTREFYDEAGRRFMADLHVSLGKRPETPAFLVKVDGMNHSSFSDYPFVYPQVIARFRGKIINPTRGWSLTGAYLRAFFGCFLDHQTTDLLRGNNTKYPEAKLMLLTPAAKHSCR